ncbi:hypothetical protein Ancab_007954 [Ancistrocladus abbreviatus]
MMVSRFVLAYLVLANLLIAQTIAHVLPPGVRLVVDPPGTAAAPMTVAEAPVSRRLLIKRHSHDKSAIGGRVIICGVITAIFAAVFLYIRATRQRKSEDS